MANNVFANGREISCKAADGKSICAFPDVCFTPPENPATPPGVPIPYPNTGMAKDTTDGSKNVKISGREVMLKNKSYFKKSVGDEAGSAAKKGVITSTNRGKVYFTSWSMDVQFEGENVVRHLDLTTHNHASFPANTITWPFIDSADFAGTGPCKKVAQDLQKACLKTEKDESGEEIYTHIHVSKSTGEIKRKETVESMCANPSCKQALKCVLQEHKSKKESNNCCGDKTTHHLVPSSEFIPHASRGSTDPATNYNDIGAPCICVEGDDHNDATKEHGIVGRRYDKLRKQQVKKNKGKPLTLNQAMDLGAQSGAAIKCDKDCLEAQLRRGHKKMELKVKGSDPVPRQ
jgi:hypothetical protein